MKCITLAQSIEYVASAAFEDCKELEYFRGYHTTSDNRGIIFDGELQCYAYGAKDKEYIIPNEVKAIGYACFNSHPFLENIVIHDSVTTIGGYAFSSCPNLKTVTLSARLKMISPMGFNPFIGSDKLESVYFRSFIPPVYNDIQMSVFPSLKIYVPEQSLELYKNSIDWKDFREYFTGYNYTDIPEDAIPDYYYSTDYAKSGEVHKLQSATVGKGIDLVFMGDGFVDRDMNEGGKYEQVMSEAMEKFFSIEPYKSFRDRFNVYALKVVSVNEEWNDNINHAIMQSDDLAFKYASAIEGINQDHLYVNVIYNSPTDGSWYGRSYTQMYYDDGSYVAYNMEGVNNVLIHEAAGHGFAKLADEYVEFDETFTDFAGLDQLHEMNWYQNVDYRNTPQDVYWNKFMADSRYDGQVGIYEGAFTYSNGVYRPTENSMMRYNDSPFNAPSREAIYKAIMRESEGEGWVYNYEDFVAYDAINRQTVSNAPCRTPSKRDIEEYEKHHKAPVIVAGGWRDAGAKKDEQTLQTKQRQTPDLANLHRSQLLGMPTDNSDKESDMAKNTAPIRPSNSKAKEDVTAFEMSETKAIENGAVMLDLSIKPGFIATQFDVILPEGTSLTKAALAGKNAETHKMTYRCLDGNRVRVVIFSMNNAEMSEELVRLTLQGEGEVVLTNALVNELQTGGKITEKAVSAVRTIVSGNATGISSLNDSMQKADGMYNLNGQKVNADYKGIVIKNGTKIVR